MSRKKVPTIHTHLWYSALILPPPTFNQDFFTMSVPDEEQPLLRQITEDDTKHDEVILDFEPMDPEDPRNWSPAFKWCIVLLLASMAFTVYVPVVFLDCMTLVANPSSSYSISGVLLIHFSFPLCGVH
jgi:hypothetical protein